MTLPAYQMPGALDFSGMTNALARWNDNTFKQAQVDNQREHTQIQRDTLALHQEQYSNQQKLQMAEMMGKRALAIDQLPIGPARTAAYAQFMAQNPNAHTLGPEWHDPVRGPSMVAADAGQFRDKLADDLRRSQINMHNASAEASRAHGRVYDAMAQTKSGPPGQMVDPTRGFGMTENGELIDVADREPARPEIMSQYLAAGRSRPDEVRREHVDFGPMGTLTTDVPGIVTTPKGSMDRGATREYQGQRALETLPDDARQRFLSAQSIQRRWEAVRGPPPKGYIYNEDGTLKDLKDESKKAISRDKIGALIDDVKTARDVLTNTNTGALGRGIAHATGGYMLPENEQAMRSVEHAVQFLTAEVEGKRHANAQDVRMLRFFAPQWGDSDEMIGFKLDQLHRIMLGYFGQKEQSGALFKSVLAKANEERMKREGKASGRAPPAARPSPSTGDLRGTSTDELIRMLGQ